MPLSLYHFLWGENQRKKKSTHVEGVTSQTKLLGLAVTPCYIGSVVRDDLFSTAMESPAAVPQASPRPDTRRHQPLAARMRPQSLSEFAGQTHILGPGQL